MAFGVRSDLPDAPRIVIQGHEALLAMDTVTKNPIWRSLVLKGLRKTVSRVENIHKRTVIIGGRGRTKKGGPWMRRTGELSRSFHSRVDQKDLSATYGSQLTRAAVVELGTNVALGGPLKSSGIGAGGGRKLLAIPTDNARVGKGGAVWPSRRDDLVFVMSRSGKKLLVASDGVTASGRKKAATPLRVMYILVPEVTIEPHPTLEPTTKIVQPQARQIMSDAVSEATAAAIGIKKGRKGGH